MGVVTAIWVCEPEGMTRTSRSSEVPALSSADQASAVSKILLGPVLKGPIIRRPRAVDVAERFDLDSVGVTEMQRLHARYGPGPVRCRILGRRIALILDPSDVHRVLDGSPTPFSPATWEKRGALNHFEPAGSLISSPEQRLSRRPLNERLLETARPVHSHAGSMMAVIEQEIAMLLGHADFTGALDWDSFEVAWWRIIRQVVLGRSAREDVGITNDLQKLRKRANFAYFAPLNRHLRARFLENLTKYVDRAEPGSLAAMVATDAVDGAEPVQQIPQWLFAFDAAAWATFRALSLLSTQPGAMDAARDDLSTQNLPYLRATVLESLRLWPTTPLILRDTTEATTWRNGTLPAETAIVIFTPYFHRDEHHFSDAHVFVPDLWRDGRANSAWPLVPFSGGPGMCPGRNVVLLTCSMVLGELIRERRITSEKRLDPQRLPGTLSPFSSHFTVFPTL